MFYVLKTRIFTTVLSLWLNFYPFTSLLGLNIVTGKTISVYDGFCKDKLLYKPYLKYYRGRLEAVKTGIPFKTHPPGFWTDFLDDDMGNIYVCINGMAWLYYRLKIDSTVVYEAPELHSYVHNCMLVNGVKGPGMHNTERLLLGILLMGNQHDYRRPSLQLFTAPYQVIPGPFGSSPPHPFFDPIPGEIYNATSLMMFGGETECILLKGRKKTEIRIRSDNIIALPKFPTNNETFCRLNYKNVTENLKTAKQADYVMVALKHDEIIRTKGCYLPKKYTYATENIINARVAQIQDMNKLTTDTDLFDVTFEKWFNKAGRLPEDTSTVILRPQDFWPEEVCIFLAKQPDPEVDNCFPKQLKQAIQDQELIIEAEKKKTSPDRKIIEQAEVDIMLVKTRISQTNAYKAGTALGDKDNGLYKKLIDDWNDAQMTVKEVTTQLKNIEDWLNQIALYKDDPNKKKDYDAAVAELKLAELAYYTKSKELTPIVSQAEARRLQLEQQLQVTFNSYTDLLNDFRIAKAKGVPKRDLFPKLPLVPDVIVIKRAHDDYLKKDDKVTDPTKFESNATKSCGELPKNKDECKKIKPTKQRSCQLLNARLGKFFQVPPPPEIIPVPAVVVDWKAEDVWREDVLQLIEDIFYTACKPMLKMEFSLATGRIMRGYLTDMINGTIARKPQTSGPGTTTTPPPITRASSALDEEPIDLPSRRLFWDQIIRALKDCKQRDIRLYFRRFMNGDEEDYKYIKRHPNGSLEDIVVEHFIEQADNEFAFNFVIDSNWRMFATVLGLCMPFYENEIPLISAKFFTFYTEDFLHPLAREWIMIRDNTVFRYVLGDFYNGIGEQWSKLCMEASYLESGDVRYRPPRSLLVNGLTEANFFTSGPLSGTSGIYN